MTKIFSPSEIRNGFYPDLLCVDAIVHESRELLRTAYEKGEIIGASQYGSFNRKSDFNETSDLDWIIIFKDIEALLNSDELHELQYKHKEAHIPFTSPVLSLESIESENHLIAILVEGVKQTVNRIIIGRDPVELINTSDYNKQKTLSRMFASYPRYFFEKIATEFGLLKDDENVLHDLFQRSVDYSVDTYRSMVSIAMDEAPIDFNSYEDLYKKEIGSSTMERGMRIEGFLSEYKKRISQVLEIFCSNENEERRNNILSQYKIFLQNNEHIITDGLKFCQENISYFRTKYQT